MSAPTHKAYKDSGVAWLGQVPAHWAVLPVKRVLRSIEQGWSPQCESYPAEPGHWGVLKVGCVNGGMFNPAENKALPPTLEPISALAIQCGDVLVSRANTRELVGSVAVADRTYDSLMLCDKLYRLRTETAVCEPAFLARYLGGSAARGVIERAATGASSSMLNIGQAAITEMPIALPPANEQRQLLEFLDRETAKIDALVEEQQRLIELLKEKRQAVISQAVTKGLDPNVPMKDSGVEWLGAVPAHWRVGALGHLAAIDSGATPDRGNPDYWNGHIPWIKTGEINYQPIASAEEHITDIGLANSSAKLAKPGTILMAMYGQGATRGRVSVLTVEAAYNQACAAIRLGTEVRPQFGYCFLRAAYEHVRDSGNETSQMNLGTGAISKFRVPVPPLAEQDAIVAYLNEQLLAIDDLLTEVNTAALLLGERRSALISAAVTGKIDVRGLVSQPEGAAA